MNRIYCVKNENDTLDFFITGSSGERYICTQKPYKTLYDMYRIPVPVHKAVNFKRADENTILRKFMEKLPVYLRYIEKYDGYDNMKKRKNASHKRKINPINYYNALREAV